jgi:hypothetical protein
MVADLRNGVIRTEFQIIGRLTPGVSLSRTGNSGEVIRFFVSARVIFGLERRVRQNRLRDDEVGRVGSS